MGQDEAQQTPRICLACHTACPSTAQHCPTCGSRLDSVIGQRNVALPTASLDGPHASTSATSMLRSELAAETMLQGRYCIERVLGAGTFGRVYLATDILDEHGLPIAVKELLDTHFTTPDEKQEAISWFKREVGTLLALDHPGIPAIHAYWTAQRMAGPFYLAMDYIPGPTMDEVLQDSGRVAWQQTVEWGLALCEVLAYLHNQTPPFVFRDIKLSNVIIDARTNRPVLIDFGITRQLASGSGTAIGSWGYAPFEQVLGKAEPRSDLYALGATLHALLTGRHPDGEYTRLQRSGLDVEATMQALFPPANTLTPDVPPSIAEALARATAFAPADRFIDAAAMSTALQGALDNQTLVTTTPVVLTKPAQSPASPIGGGHASASPTSTPPATTAARTIPARTRRSSNRLAREVFVGLCALVIWLVSAAVLPKIVGHGTAPNAGSREIASQGHHTTTARPTVFTGMPVEFTNLAFVSDRTGYALGADGRVFKTTDGARHWRQVTARRVSGLAASPFETVGSPAQSFMAFPNSTTGYAVGDTLLQTSDSGKHWRPLPALSANSIASIAFPDMQTGYTTDGDSTLLKTMDGGKHWQDISPGGGFTGVKVLAFPRVNIGYAAVDPGALDKTTDGGRDWNELLSFPNDYYSTILALAFPSVRTGYVALDGNELLKTTDGGQHWQQLPNGPWTSFGPSPVYLDSLVFPNAITGYAITKQDNGEGTSNIVMLLKTTDGGKRWRQLSSITSASS